MRTDQDMTPDEHPDQGLNLSVENPADLEARVHRLEEAVVSLQDTHVLEERIVERLAGRLKDDLADKITSQPRQPPPGYTDEPSSTRNADLGHRQASNADSDNFFSMRSSSLSNWRQ